MLEHLLTHGPESVAEEFQSDKEVISQLNGFRYIDENGYVFITKSLIFFLLMTLVLRQDHEDILGICRFNWGLTVRKKSERVMKLLEEGTHLKEERNHARRLSRGIQGFGSFSQRSTPAPQGILREKSLPTTLGRCNSDLNNREDQEKQSSCSNNSVAAKSASQQVGNFNDIGKSQQLLQESESTSKENMEPTSGEEFHLWNLKGESKPLLDCGEENSKLGIFRTEDDHPFNSTTEMHATTSLISARDGTLHYKGVEAI